MSIFQKMADEAAKNTTINGLKTFTDYNQTVKQLMMSDNKGLKEKGITPEALKKYGVIVVSSQSHLSKTTQKGGNGKMSWQAAKDKKIANFDKKTMSSLGGKLYFAELRENSTGLLVPVSLARIEQENLLLKSWVSASGKTQEELYQIFLKGQLSFQKFVTMLFNPNNQLFEWVIAEGSNKGVEAAVFTLAELQSERSSVVDDYSFLIETDDTPVGESLKGMTSALPEESSEDTDEIIETLEGVTVIERAKELAEILDTSVSKARKMILEYDKAMA